MRTVRVGEWTRLQHRRVDNVGHPRSSKWGMFPEGQKAAESGKAPQERMLYMLTRREEYRGMNMDRYEEKLKKLERTANSGLH